MEVKETFHLLLFCIGDSMNPYLLIVFLFFSLFGFEKIDGQNQFDGYWSGFITQVPAGISDRYFFSFEVQSDGAERRNITRLTPRRRDPPATPFPPACPATALLVRPLGTDRRLVRPVRPDGGC